MKSKFLNLEKRFENFYRNVRSDLTGMRKEINDLKNQRKPEPVRPRHSGSDLTNHECLEGLW
jgi:hypothetical protein